MLIDLVLDPTDRAAAELLDLARIAESLDLDGVWTYDHLSGATLGGSSTHDVWALLGAIAAVTDEVTIGPLVANVTTRHPAYLAVAAATLQELSGGRAMLGVGAGAGPGSPFAREMVMIGMEPRPAATRREMVAEAVRTIRALWAGEPDRASDHFPLADAEGFLRPGPVPPIIVGCNGPKLAAVAAEVADGVNFHSFEPDLAGLVAATRELADRDDFVVTVEAPLDEAVDRAFQDRLTELKVDRLMMRMVPTDTIADVEAAVAALRG